MKVPVWYTGKNVKTGKGQTDGTGIDLVHSKYGAARKYAEWLKEKTGFPVLETKQVTEDQLARPDTVILLGGVYASGIGGMGFLRKHWQALAGKKLAVFAVGASPYEEENLTLLKQHNLRPPMEEVPCFYGRGDLGSVRHEPGGPDPVQNAAKVSGQKAGKPMPVLGAGPSGGRG